MGSHSYQWKEIERPPNHKKRSLIKRFGWPCALACLIALGAFAGGGLAYKESSEAWEQYYTAQAEHREARKQLEIVRPVLKPVFDEMDAWITSSQAPGILADYAKPMPEKPIHSKLIETAGGGVVGAATGLLVGILLMALFRPKTERRKRLVHP
jgi:hypothetical protein